MLPSGTPELTPPICMQKAPWHVNQVTLPNYKHSPLEKKCVFGRLQPFVLGQTAYNLRGELFAVSFLSEPSRNSKAPEAFQLLIFYHMGETPIPRKKST